jgi:hypothetical protein
MISRMLNSIGLGSRPPSLEIHIPASPNRLFLNMVQCLTCSLRRNGGSYRNSPVIVTLGDESPDPVLAERLPWLRENGIELRWVPRDQFIAHSYAATGNQRLRYDFQSDVVLLLDADVLIAGPLDDLIETVHSRQTIAGVIAHISPFEHRKCPYAWQELQGSLGLRAVRAEYEHTGWGYMSSDERFRYTPPYFNYGVVCAPRGVVTQIGRVSHDLLRCVRSRFPDFFFDNQVALSLAIAKLSLPHWCLPMRYNFPNDPLLEALHAAELPHTRIIHLLRNHQQVSKTDLFASLESLTAFTHRRDLRVINRLAQQIIADALPSLHDVDADVLPPPARAA